MVIVGTIGIQKDKAQVHNLDQRNLAAIRAPDESSDADESEASSSEESEDESELLELELESP